MGEENGKEGEQEVFHPPTPWARALTDFADVGQSERVKILLSVYVVGRSDSPTGFGLDNDISRAIMAQRIVYSFQWDHQIYINSIER